MLIESVTINFFDIYKLLQVVFKQVSLLRSVFILIVKGETGIEDELPNVVVEGEFDEVFQELLWRFDYFKVFATCDWRIMINLFFEGMIVHY